MASSENVEELKIKVGLKTTDPHNEYEFIDKLGEGSYGSVLLARHKVTQTEHAIKQVPVEENLQDILRETEHIMECNCENIVGYDDCYLINNQLWIVMEYCAGGSLADLMKLGNSTLNEDQIAVVVRDVLKALAYLHDNNRIHRDIKAGNILLTSDGTSKLADFGVSGTLSKENSARHTVIGTPFWMAPEVIQETGHNYKADIWSLGITIIELAEGHPPLCNLHPLRAIFVIPSRAPPTFSEKTRWSDEMNDFLARCLTKEATKRPSAKQLLEHPWLLKRAHITGDVLKPLLEISEQHIKAAGGRDSALESLYASKSSSGTSSPASGSFEKKSSGDDDDDDDENNYEDYGTMQIKKSDDAGSDSDSYEADFNTMKVKKQKKPKQKKPQSDDEEDYGTMKIIKTKSDDNDSSNEYEDLGTIQIKKPKEKKKKKKSKSKEESSTVIVKSSRKEEKLGTLNRFESPKVKAARLELEELDVKMVADLQNLTKQKDKDKEMIARILAARKA